MAPANEAKRATTCAIRLNRKTRKVRRAAFEGAGAGSGTAGTRPAQRPQRGLACWYRRCALTSGHSPERRLYITVSRIVPSRRMA